MNLWGDIKLVAPREAITGSYGTDVGTKLSSPQVIRLFKMLGLSIARMFRVTLHRDYRGFWPAG